MNQSVVLKDLLKSHCHQRITASSSVLGDAILLEAALAPVLLCYLLLRRVFFAACGLSLVMVSRGYSSLRCPGFSLLWLLLLQSTGPRAHRLQQMRRAGSVAPRHAGSSWTRDLTRVSRIDRWVLNHWATRETPDFDSSSDD